MDISWTVILPLIVNLSALGTVWWQIDAKIEKRLGRMDDRLDRMDAKCETVNQTLLTLTHDVGELKGQVGALVTKN